MMRTIMHVIAVPFAIPPKEADENVQEKLEEAKNNDNVADIKKYSTASEVEMSGHHYQALS